MKHQTIIIWLKIVISLAFGIPIGEKICLKNILPVHEKKLGLSTIIIFIIILYVVLISATLSACAKGKITS